MIRQHDVCTSQHHQLLATEMHLDSRDDKAAFYGFMRFIHSFYGFVIWGLQPSGASVLHGVHRDCVPWLDLQAVFDGGHALLRA